uniref:Ribosome biogenesis protein NOP53 n=1 Tax=Timema shepardi TaxID=629360 RepID=A0A7R9AL78_TIMSH|nr:unnamed protein product [Timema shepardi]
MVSAVKKRRVSKKNKKAWRKHTDVADVDEFLDEKRLEERLGTPFTERHNNELFSIDKELKKPTKAQFQTKRQRRQQLKPLKCFEILTPQSKVQDPVIKRNRVKTPEERKSALVKRIEAKRKLLGIVKAKDIIAQRNRTAHQTWRESRPKRGEFNSDLWEVEDGKLEGNNFGELEDWMLPSTIAHNVKNTGRFKKKAPNSVVKKPFIIAAVEIPHPGMSYNPSFVAHQDLLQKVADTELKVLKEEKHLERVTTRMFSKVTPNKKESSWLTEMSEGLPTQLEPEVKEERLSDDDEYRAINPPAKNKKKTLKQRRKIREAKKDELKRKHVDKVEKKKASDIYKLRFLNQQLSKQESKLEVIRNKRERKEKARLLQPKHLSKVRFQPLDLEFNLRQELKGNLRNVKPQGNLLKSRLNSLQSRNVIEPGKLHFKKKGKVKKFEKSTHKMGWEPKGY